MNASDAARILLRRLGTGLGILLTIACLARFGLVLAERGKAGLPTRPDTAAVEALRGTLQYVANHPDTYLWHRQVQPAWHVVRTLFTRSAALLLISLLIAFSLGVPLGIGITLWRGGRMAPLVLPLAVLGISVPSFLLAMLFWIANVQVARWLGLARAPLPPTGFGWDAHLVMPALVLAMRPLAQIIQVTHVSLAGVLNADYIRTAHAKGLRRGVVVNRHALRNILIPILTTLGVSLRFSLATLPVVETFFVWPGLGLGLLQAIEADMPALVMDLIVALGLLFLLVNAALEAVYQVVDPRLRGRGPLEIRAGEPPTWRERWQGLREALAALGAWCAGLGPLLARLRQGRHGQPSARQRRAAAGQRQAADAALPGVPGGRRGAFLASALNPSLLIGTALVLGLAALVVFGARWAAASPYETHGVMMLEGTIAAPPFPPSHTFPWGSDAVGRDIQAQVLAGAKTTLTLALLAVLARMFLGTVLGLQAGWWRGSAFDRLVNGVMAVWAAFPVTLFALILILGLGIQQGMGVFVVALCVVGWGEIAQFVRGQVISLKPQPYIEGARTIGARSSRILGRHVLPHLWGPLLVLAALEMASVLMLLAELGFLNIFLGGGFKAEIGESGRMQPVIYFFSDVPEWGALLANVRNWWRSYPWMAWYPGAAFFLAILAFNVWGHGLRRFLDDSRVNIGRVINRYTVVATALAIFGAGWLVRSMTPVNRYAEQARTFDAGRALRDIEALASPRFAGRESGTPGAGAAAAYIAARMEEIGLYPAGQGTGYLYPMAVERAHLAGMPRLAIAGSAPADADEELIYRRDFVEYAGYAQQAADGRGPATGLVLGPEPDETAVGYVQNLMGLDLAGKVLVMRQADWQRFAGILARMRGAERIIRRLQGILIVGDDPRMLARRDVHATSTAYYLESVPAMLITAEVADRLLAPGSLDALTGLAGSLGPGQVALSPPGQPVHLVLPMAPADPGEQYIHVIGFIPGTGAQMGQRAGDARAGQGESRGLDASVVIVSAYYDGLGTGPDGTLYPGANDNASGVAAMLEIARVLVESPAPPRKTIVFVAWSGGERREGFSVANAMSAKRGFNLLTVEAVIELSGLGAGSGSGLALGPGTSFSLVQTFQAAASRVGVPVTTRGRGPHFGIATASGFGGRSALSAYVSWDGSDANAHTAADTVQAIEEEKLRLAGATVLLAVSVLGQAGAQESPLGPLEPAPYYVNEARGFDEQAALQHVAYLASDALEGRRAGSAGGQAAGVYIAARFADYALLPSGADGSYFQPFAAPESAPVTSAARSTVGAGATEAQPRNVLGLLPGSDPDRRDEVVILGASYDGLGRDPDGATYNGANCNASGVGALLEIARLWQAQGYRPARSVLFAAWDASEQDGLGARHYVAHPAYPLDRTVAVLNLAMVGRAADLAVEGRGPLAERLAAGAGAYGATLAFVPQVTWGDSLPFNDAGIPTATLRGIEDSTHPALCRQPEDDIGSLQPAALRAAGVLAAHSLAGWAGGGPTARLPDAGPRRTARDLILPTPTCAPPWPLGAMTCDHGQWAR